MKIGYLLIFLVLVSSCSINSDNVSEDFTLQPDKGLVVFSLTASGECGYALFVDIRSLDGTYNKTIGMQDMFEERDWNRKTSDCNVDSDDYSGKLKAISLHEGAYEIYNLSGISKYDAFSTSNKMSIRFKVKGNSITYIGNAHFAIGEKSFTFSITDKRARDMKLFQEKYPRFNSDYIVDISKS